MCACAALVAAFVLAPLPAAAQQVRYASQRAEILDTSTLSSTADLDFGIITPNATGGTVVLTPSATPTCTTTGGLVHTAACKAARFDGTAFAGADLRVRRPMPNSITLTGPLGNTMTVTTFTMGSTAPTVYQGPPPGNSPNHRFQVNAPDGSFTFYVGGTLNVGANQRPGVYTGSFQIDISYN